MLLTFALSAAVAAAVYLYTEDGYASISWGVLSFLPTLWIVWLLRNRRKGLAKNAELRTPTSRVPTTVDPNQSEVYFMGGSLLTIVVAVSIKNQHDKQVQLDHVDLFAVMKSGSRLKANGVAFNYEGKSDAIDIDQVQIAAKTARSGWFLFTYDEDIRPADFKHFELQVQAIGEPKEIFLLEPYNWADIRERQSKMVMLPRP